MANQIPAIPTTTSTVIELVSVMNDRLRRIDLLLGGSSSSAAASATLNYGTHAVRLGRPVANYPSGSIFVETDRTVEYQMRANVWTYSGGMMKAVFASAPTGLGTGDAGFLWYVSDYAHVLRWTGTGWEFVDEMGGWVAWRVVAPDGNGWQLCDGTATKYLHISAGVASEVAHTTLNMTGNPLYLKMGAAYGGAINAAQPPATGAPSATTAAAGAGSAASATHTHAITLVVDPVANAVGLPYFRR